MVTCRIAGLEIGGNAPVRLMGVINCSPESFFSGSFVKPGHVYERARDLVDQGAEIIDIGARSTAPTAPPISVATEKERLLGALREMSGSGIPISIDTMYPEVLAACLRYDIHAVNDIHGFVNEKLAALTGDAGLPAILMASIKEPGDAMGIDQTMYALELVLERAERAGVEEIVLDPAIGRWTETRRAEHDWSLCRQFSGFLAFDRPILAAISRKSFIGDLLQNDPDERLAGSLAVTCHLLHQGASMVRTHDVRETRDVIRVFERLR